MRESQLIDIGEFVLRARVLSAFLLAFFFAEAVFSHGQEPGKGKVSVIGRWDVVESYSIRNRAESIEDNSEAQQPNAVASLRIEKEKFIVFDSSGDEMYSDQVEFDQNGPLTTTIGKGIKFVFKGERTLKLTGGRVSRIAISPTKCIIKVLSDSMLLVVLYRDDDTAFGNLLTRGSSFWILKRIATESPTSDLEK